MQRYLLTLNDVAMERLAEKSDKLGIDEKELLSRIIENGLRSCEDNFGTESSGAGDVQAQELELEMGNYIQEEIDKIEAEKLQKACDSISSLGMSI